MLNHSSLHYTILKYIIDHGHAPDVKNLSHLLKKSEETVIQALYDLQEYHGVVLHPHEPKIWVIHPFSLAPTNFLVSSARGQWWGNCAWCSLGVAAVLQEDVTIKTSFGAYGDPLTLHIQNGEIQEKDLLVHFPIAMQKAWDNVIYTCSNMLIFKEEQDIDSWSERHQIPKGDVQRIDHLWAFSQKWYGNHLNPNWQKWTLEEAKGIFQEFGLTHEIWQLEGSDQRF